MLQIFELPPSQFEWVMPLFETAWFDEMFIMPSLRGAQPGRVFVDRIDQPGAAILFRTYEFYIAGNPNSAAMRAFIKDAPAEPGVFQGFHGFAPLSKAWDTALIEDYGNGLIVLPRCNFRWEGASVMSWQARLPNGASVLPITIPLAQRLDQEWQEGIGALWSGYDRFARDGYGFCLMMADGQLGSVVYTDGADDHSASIGVRTNPALRRQGFASVVCSAFIEATLARGMLPVWECEERNTASKRLAQKLGFVERKPFSDIVVPGYGPLPLSHGRWESAPNESGRVLWTKIGHAGTQV